MLLKDKQNSASSRNTMWSMRLKMFTHVHIKQVRFILSTQEYIHIYIDFSPSPSLSLFTIYAIDAICPIIATIMHVVAPLNNRWHYTMVFSILTVPSRPFKCQLVAGHIPTRLYTREGIFRWLVANDLLTIKKLWAYKAVGGWGFTHLYNKVWCVGVWG